MCGGLPTWKTRPTRQSRAGRVPSRCRRSLSARRARLEIESRQQPDSRHAVRRRPHLEEHATLAAHADDEVETRFEIGVAEVEAIVVAFVAVSILAVLSRRLLEPLV